MSCLVLAIISISILNSLVLVLRHYRMSDHPMIQLRFNALFSAQRCSEHTLAPHLFMPLTLAIKFFQVYALYYAPTPLLLHQYLTVLILSIIVRPFLRTYNLLNIVFALPGNSATLQIPTDSSHDSSLRALYDSLWYYIHTAAAIYTASVSLRHGLLVLRVQYYCGCCFAWDGVG